MKHAVGLDALSGEMLSWQLLVVYIFPESVEHYLENSCRQLICSEPT